MATRKTSFDGIILFVFFVFLLGLIRLIFTESNDPERRYSSSPPIEVGDNKKISVTIGVRTVKKTNIKICVDSKQTSFCNEPKHCRGVDTCIIYGLTIEPNSHLRVMETGILGVPLGAGECSVGQSCTFKKSRLKISKGNVPDAEALPASYETNVTCKEAFSIFTRRKEEDRKTWLIGARIRWKVLISNQFAGRVNFKCSRNAKLEGEANISKSRRDLSWNDVPEIGEETCLIGEILDSGTFTSLGIWPVKFSNLDDCGQRN